MKAVQTTFEQVLDVKRHNVWIDGPSTTFRFFRPGRQSRAVTVPGTPELRDGMSVIAVLRDGEDWGSMVGWKDLQTGAIVAIGAERARKAIIWRAVFVVALLIAWAAGVSLGMLFGVFTMMVFSLWQSVRELLDSRATLLKIAEFERESAYLPPGQSANGKPAVPV